MKTFKTRSESKAFFQQQIEDSLLLAGLEKGDAWYDVMQAKWETWRPLLSKVNPVCVERENTLYRGWDISDIGESISPEQIYERLIRGDATPFEAESIRKEGAARIRREWRQRFKDLRKENRGLLREWACDISGLLEQLPSYDLYQELTRPGNELV